MADISKHRFSSYASTQPARAASAIGNSAKSYNYNSYNQKVKRPFSNYNNQQQTLKRIKSELETIQERNENKEGINQQ